AIRLRGNATLSCDPETPTGVQIWAGVWEMDGRDLNISIGDLEMHGNKFEKEVSGKTGKAVGAGVSVIRLTGNGVSTIKARKLNFVDAAAIDVSALNVPMGTYQLIDGTGIAGSKLTLAHGTDPAKWSLRLNAADGDVFLERR
ncbi:MAG: hypothetical protein ACPGVU_10655, partial [Limisphaerales bacterium]